jgi:hypothetical protein
MESLTLEDLTIQIEPIVGGTIRVLWSGKSNSRDPGRLLVPYFTRLLKEATATKSSVEMRFEKLEHFNSSTIAAVIQVINAARDQGVWLTLFYDPNLKWQALSFDALRRALKPFETNQTSRVQFFTAGRP